MVPFVLLALPAIVPRPVVFGRVVSSGATILMRPAAESTPTAFPSTPAPWLGPPPPPMPVGNARELALDDVEVRVGTGSTWATEGFVLCRRGGVWSGLRLEPSGWVQRPVAKAAGAAILRALTGFDRWPDSPPPIEIGNDVPLTTVRILGAGRCRAFSGVTGGTDEAWNLARLVREALD